MASTTTVAPIVASFENRLADYPADMLVMIRDASGNLREVEIHETVAVNGERVLEVRPNGSF